MKKNRTLAGLPGNVTFFLERLGKDLRLSRLRRNMSQEALAKAMFTSRQTVARLEAGDPGVSLGMFCTAVFCLGRFKELEGILSANADFEGVILEQRRTLSRRGGLKRKKTDLDF